MMNIAVLMTCHNRRETTLRCLRSLSLACQGVVSCDVFLVDDGSVDDTGDAVRKWAEDSGVNVRIIPADGTLYWARGMALAWKTAISSRGNLRYQHYLWLNDDVDLKPTALQEALRDWENCGNPLGVIVGACSKDMTERESSYAATDLHDVRIFPNGQGPQRALGWFNGNFVLVPEATRELVGMICDDYTHARADYDYAERLKKFCIPFFASSHFVGVCKEGRQRDIRSYVLGRRLHLLVEPGYWNLRDLWTYRRRHFGILRALVSCVHLVKIVILAGWGER